jgi:hypothetical protein
MQHVAAVGPKRHEFVDSVGVREFGWFYTKHACPLRECGFDGAGLARAAANRGDVRNVAREDLIE